MTAAMLSSRPRIKRPSRPRAKIGLTPLIDVIFILLIFFMLATRFDVWQALDVGAGKAAHAESDIRPLHLIVKGEGRYELGGETLEAAGVTARLAAALREEDRPVFVEPGEGAAFAALIEAADMARAAGAAKLAFVDKAAAP